MNLMVVDDNKMFRRALMTMMDWQAHDIHMVAQAMNGAHALEIIDDYKIDVVITDMSMPEMNGIELVKALKAAYPHMGIVVVSNYDDFEFVKEALKLGADDYLLKHEMQADSLLSILIEVANKSGRSPSTGNRLGTLDHERIDRLMSDYLLKGGSDDLVKKHLHQVFAQPGVYYLMQIQPHEEVGHLDDIRLLIEAGSISGCQWIDFVLQRSHLYLLIRVEMAVSEKALHKGLVAIESNIHQLIDDDTRAYTLIRSRGSRSIEDLPKLYNQVLKTRASGRYDSPCGTMEYRCSHQQVVKADTDTYMNHLLYDQKTIHDKDLYMTYLKGIFKKIQEKPVDTETLNKIVYEIASAVVFLSKELHVSIYESIDDSTNAFRAINRFYYVCDKEAFALSVVNYLYEKTNFYEGVSHEDVKRIMKYIDGHYGDSLSLKSLAQVFGYSTSYLSHLFKQETHQGLMDYIKDIRIYHAKALITEGQLKTYEIATAVGFNNTSYFCTVFKEVTGVSPKAYKNRGRS